MLSYSSLCNNKEVLASNSRGKMKIKHSLYRQRVTLEHDTLLLSCRVWDILTSSLALWDLGSSFCLIPFDPYCLYMTFDPLVPKCYLILESFPQYVQELNPSVVYTLTSSSNSLFHPSLYFSFVSCRWCGKYYGPSAMDYSLSTSTHYPGSWSRDSFRVP